MRDFSDSLVEILANVLHNCSWQHWGSHCQDPDRVAKIILAAVSTGYTILPISDYNDLFDRSEKLKRIEWQMNNPCDHCGGECLECQHYDDKRRYGQ